MSRRVPHAGPGPGRAVVLPRPPLAARRRAQHRVPDPAAEGQARQPVQRVERDRAGRGRRLAGRRGGPGRPHDHRHGHPHPARLRARRHRHHAARPPPRRSTTPPTARPSARTLVDQPLMREVLADLAVESEAATVTAMRLARAFDEAARGDEDADASARIGHGGGQVLGVQAPADRTWARRSSAWAGTATSRSRSCPGCSARARSTASGRGRAT